MTSTAAPLAPERRHPADALWSIEFSAAGAARFDAGGVVVLANGRILGGDRWYTIIGDFRELPGEGRIEGTVTVKEYRPGAYSILGLKNYTLRFSSPAAHDQMTLACEVVEKPGVQMDVRLVRRAEL